MLKKSDFLNMTKIRTSGSKVRKILLISDTHGNLDIINQLVAQTNADMVIHAGDFGFYDEQSIYRLSPRELLLLVSHSPV
jgi:Icc-related predicted phosphoesterase